MVLYFFKKGCRIFITRKVSLLNWIKVGLFYRSYGSIHYFMGSYVFFYFVFMQENHLVILRSMINFKISNLVSEIHHCILDRRRRSKDWIFVTNSKFLIQISLQPEAEFKEFERRPKFKPRIKYGWFHLKFY